MNENTIKSKKGSQLWHKNGQIHREDGPAIVFFNGIKEWYENGEFIKNEIPFKIRLKNASITLFYVLLGVAIGGILL